MLREFTKSDWRGFAGVECFADDSLPLITEAGEGPFTIIVDATGVSVTFYNEIYDTFSASRLRLPENKAACTIIARELSEKINAAPSMERVRAAITACGLPAMEEL